MSTGRIVRPPDATVRHEQRTVSPTAITPRMLKCIVGPLYEIVDPTVSGVPNSDAVATTPAYLMGAVVADALVTPSASAKYLKIQTASGVTEYALPVSSDPDQLSYSLQKALDYIVEAVPELQATVVGDCAVIETVAKGDSAFLRLLPITNDAYTVLGIKEFESVTLRGTTTYQNARVETRFTSLPDPRGNLDQLDIDEDSLRAWLNRGGTLVELQRDRAVLRHRYALGASTQPRPYVGFETLSTFPQARFAHDLRPKDDGDGDGQTAELYARGANAALVLYGADRANDYLVLEAWGDQDAANVGPYHGAVGNLLNVRHRPSEHAAAATLVTTSGRAITLYPHVRIEAKLTGDSYADPAALVGQAITVATTGWTANVAAASLSRVVGADYYYYLTLYNLALGAGGDPLIPVFKNILVGDVLTLAAKSPVIQASSIQIVTTLGEIQTALEASASGLVRVTAYGDATEEITVGDDLFALTLGAGEPAQVKTGDILRKADNSWTGLAVAVDATGPTVLLTAGVVPAAGDTVKRVGSDATILFTIQAGGAVYQMLQVSYFCGGRDPISFQGTPGAAAVRSVLPATKSTDYEVAGLVRVTNASATLPTRGRVVFGTSGAQGRVLDAYGLSHIMVGFNIDGEVPWPLESEVATITPEDGGTAVTATVIEFHTVIETNSMGTTAIVAGDVIYLNDGADTEARSFLLRSVADPTADIGQTVRDAAGTWSGVVVSVSGGGPYDAAIRLASGSHRPTSGAGETYGRVAPYNAYTPTAVTAPAVNEWSVEVVRSTRIENPVNAAARKYRLVVKNVTRTLDDGAVKGRGLPGGKTTPGTFGITDASLAPTACGQDISATDDAIVSHKLKQIPTAGTNLYVSVSGAAEAQVLLEGDEVMFGGLATHSVQRSLNDALSDDDSPYFATNSGAYLYLQNSGLPNANPNNWRDNAGGQENTIRVRGDGVPFIFGSGYLQPAVERSLRATHRAFDTAYDYTSMPAFGEAFRPQIGDELYDGSVLIGKVSAIQTLELGGQSFTGAKLVIDRKVSSTAADYQNWYLLALSLTEGVEPDDYNTDIAATERPYPQFSVYTAGQRLHVLHDVMRLGDGVPASGLRSSLYFSYRGLRLDVSAQGSHPALVLCGDPVTLANDYGPVRPENPLAWALYLAMQEGPGRIIAGLGLDEVSADLPYGTALAHARAIVFLGTQDKVYSRHILGYQPVDIRNLWLAEDQRLNTPPNLDDPTADTHVWETRTIMAIDLPDENLPTALGAGIAESGGTNILVFHAELDVRAALRNAGIDPSSTPSEFRALGVYVEITSDTRHYLVRSISGQTVQVTVVHPPGANDDAFWADTNLALTAGGEVCGLYQRGAAFASTDERAEATAQMAEQFGENEFRCVIFAPRVVTPYSNVDYVVDGHFVTACLAGWMSYYPETQSFSNMPLRSVTQVYGTHDTFSPQQLDRIAGGGSMIFFRPDPDQAVVVCRHQLTNDTSDEYRMQFSIRSQRDAGAWAIRKRIRPLLGKRNITASYLAYLSTLVSGIIKNLIANGSWMPGSRFLSLVQDTGRAKRTLCVVKNVPGVPHDEADTTIVI